MCGIAGFKGKENASVLVFNSLRKLEYRGYDSWGIALRQNPIKVVKKKGKLPEKMPGIPAAGTAVGHTRWATHGQVTDDNAHPHYSSDGKIAVVHNGIIENFQELRAFLQKKGFRFSTDTDTETVPLLIEYFMGKGSNFRDAFRQALLELEGHFAVLAIHSDSDVLLGARRGSPLVVGVAEEGTFIASDAPAFLEKTKRVIYLDENEMVEVNNAPRFYDIQSYREKKKNVHTISWTIAQAEKGAFPHFMLKEIHEQPETVRLAVKQDPKLLGRVTKMLREAEGVFFIGCGTSFHACVSASYEFAEIAKMHVNTVLASEFPNYRDFLTKGTLVVAVSQSGETADLLDAVRIARGKGAKVISVVNVMGSMLTRLSDETIMMNSGPEICVLSTKTYTAQLAVLLLLAYSLAGKPGEGKKLLNKTAGRLPAIIESAEKKAKALAGKLSVQKDCFLIGRDLAFPSAMEGALKIKEVSYIHAEGFAGAELKHGTIALVEKGVPVIVLSTRRTKKEILSNAMEVKARGAFILGIGSENNPLFDDFIKVPDCASADPIAMIVPIQLLAYYLAVKKGLDPDKPRNLAKVVTVR